MHLKMSFAKLNTIKLKFKFCYQNLFILIKLCSLNTSKISKLD